MCYKREAVPTRLFGTNGIFHAKIMIIYALIIYTLYMYILYTNYIHIYIYIIYALYKYIFIYIKLHTYPFYNQVGKFYASKSRGRGYEGKFEKLHMLFNGKMTQIN